MKILICFEMIQPFCIHWVYLLQHPVHGKWDSASFYVKFAMPIPQVCSTVSKSSYTYNLPSCLFYVGRLLSAQIVPPSHRCNEQKIKTGYLSFPFNPWHFDMSKPKVATVFGCVESGYVIWLCWQLGLCFDDLC